MKRVLIVGGGLQAISTARSLKDCGYTVGIWCEKDNYVLKSGAISFKQIDPDENNLIEFIKSSNLDVVIPMSDKWALFLSERKEQIEALSSCKVATPDYEILKIAADKLKLMQFCRDNNFPHPITIGATDLSDKILSTISYPVLIKPNHSVGARGITKVLNKEELEVQLPLIQKKYGDCHLQEYISGDRPYYNVMLYRNSKGEFLAHTILKIIRYYPLNGGSSSMCQTIEDESLIELCSAVLNRLNYIGFADFDILQTERSEFRIIEINPRVPASLRGAIISGINFPKIICNDALNISLDKQQYIPGKTLRYLGLDFLWFLKAPNRFKAKPSWFKFSGKNIFYQEGGYKDWKPMIYSFWDNFSKIQIKNGKIIKRE